MPRWFLSTSPGYARVAPVAGDGFTPVAAFSTRTGGLSEAPYASLNLSEGVGDDPHAVRDNRARLVGALGLDPQTVAYATQVHGATCLTPPGPGWSGTGDALVTRRSDLTLAVGTADCMGILAWDAIGSAAAAVHAGWRGMVAGAVTVALDALLAQGVPAARLRVALGPRIGPCCFLVGPEVAEQFSADEVRSEGRRITVDLARAAQRQIARAGVRQDAVFDAAEVLPAGACTSCNPDLFFSHRRDLGRTGRSWGVVSLREARAATATERPV
jgi:YfiH family protein